MNPDPAAQAADVLRRMALDETLKERTMADPASAAIARRVADRYIGGETMDEAFDRLPAIFARGHKGSIEYTGESVRDADVANAETDVFVELAERIGKTGVDSTVSFDLSHIGLVVDPELCYRNVVRLAEATERAGAELMISAEGSDRTDLVLDIHGRLAERFTHVGVTVQARLHRTAQDIATLLDRPGRIRLVKGAFLEPDSIAYPRGSAELQDAYLTYASKIVKAGHLVAIATHDRDILETLRAEHGSALAAEHVEFEMLLGLGTEQLDALHADGFTTREYVIFGTEWWLYVLNRIAEEPARVYTAIADAAV
ncbi:proline dehydrogenase [Rhodococcus sp. AD45-ID]|uniref:proline dehydrogenase family protein n=1 Tax=unclassified Rhodococcus (in: high G+C Gram-positive bacteria) TaxID=192944 RepID=UPI0005D30491|nr:MULTISPECIES: proline dehydrogenase family protein [unclassified Rhodococcus (in: high G+C Gram-positive bacteria)]KJF24991.1 Proline dehydrogenase 1 [Rhodococcus sp. AD45]MDV8065649.1 proline dehydrogenase family protein [Rhodococcus sp. IEGM 1366]PSR43209.1 proline dehydrogenase [Rhodococcus sp. AD45-ID]RZL26640.1 MAG: proline dehydrogenase [Rhodococcus sp. (in: high G+C Gram-positive bacteria)]